MYKTNDCLQCRETCKPNRTRGLDFLSHALLIILPKCPFCILAFNSSLALCSANQVYTSTVAHRSLPTILITLALCTLVIYSLIHHYKYVRSAGPILLGAIGSCCMLLSAVFGGGETLYYLGTLLILIASWRSYAGIRKTTTTGFPEANRLATADKSA